MVVFDAASSLYLLDPSTPSPNDSTGNPLDKCQERIDYYIGGLAKANERIMLPTPALSEILVGASNKIRDYLSVITNEYSFKVGVFDERAAVEVALLTDADLSRGKPLSADGTKAKIKYDRQIVAIAKVNGAHSIVTDDRGLGTLAQNNSLKVVRLTELPLPPEDTQGQLDLSDTQSEEDE